MNNKVDKLLFGSFILAYLPSSYIDPIVMPIFLLLCLYHGVKKKTFIPFGIYSIYSVISIVILITIHNVNLLSFVVKYFSLTIFFVPLFLDKKKMISNKTLDYLSNLLIFESIVASLQYVLTILMKPNIIRLGDTVEGTLHLPIGSAAGLTHQSFIITHIILTTFLIFHFNKVGYTRKRILSVGLATMTIILASVIHMLAALFVAIALVLISEYFRNLINFKINKVTIIFSFVLIVAVGSSISYLNSRFNLINHYYNMATTQTERFGKVQMINSYFDETKEQPIYFFTGIGPGQYNSRAAMVFSGEYLGSSTVNNFVKKISMSMEAELYKKYVSKYVIFQKSEDYYWGSTGSPSSSLIALFAEHGFLLVLFLTFLCYQIVKKVRIEYTSFAIVFFFFIMLTSFQENYLELTSQILPGFIILGRLYEG